MRSEEKALQEQREELERMGSVDNFEKMRQELYGPESTSSLMSFKSTSTALKKKKSKSRKDKSPILSPMSNQTQQKFDIDMIMKEFEQNSKELEEKERIVNGFLGSKNFTMDESSENYGLDSKYQDPSESPRNSKSLADLLYSS